MPEGDVSDLRDVVDAINKLCDTMKTSSYDDESFDSCSQTGSVDLVDLPLFVADERVVPEEAVLTEVESDPDWYVACQIEPRDPDDVIFKKVEHYNTETWRQSVSRLEVANPEEVVVNQIETHAAERWSDSTVTAITNVIEKVRMQTDGWSEPPVSSVDEKVATHSDRWSDPPVVDEKVATQTDRWMDPPVVDEKVATQTDRWSEPLVVDEKVATQTDRWSDPPVVDEKVATQTDRWSDPPVVDEKVATQTDRWSDPSTRSDIVSPEDVTQKAETAAERWSDSTVSLPGQVEEETAASDEPAQAQCEPCSEMYYTASSEVSLLSDLEAADKVQEEEPTPGDKDDRKECVIAGHVAAMRERFESMTRTNTPCPDLIRSVSPTLDVFRNITPSPDHLG